MKKQLASFVIVFAFPHGTFSYNRPEFANVVLFFLISDLASA